MTLDQPWKIAALIGLLAFLRTIWGLWREAPSRKFMVELLDSGLIAFILVFIIIRPFVVQAFYIPSESMVPTLLPGDRILVNKFIYRINPPKRGDVIVFDAPEHALQGGEGRKDYVKRLIGLPGDTILVRRQEGAFVNGRLLLDAPGVPLPERDYPEDEWQHATGLPYQVPQGSYFVMGDNRNRSNDSRLWIDRSTGRYHPELPKRRVLGKAMVVFWPPHRLRLVSDSTQVYVPNPPKLAAAPRGTGG
jgi:signal peptidase I